MRATKQQLVKTKEPRWKPSDVKGEKAKPEQTFDSKVSTLINQFTKQTQLEIKKASELGGQYKKWASKQNVDRPLNLDIQIGHDAEEMF